MEMSKLQLRTDLLTASPAQGHRRANYSHLSNKKVLHETLLYTLVYQQEQKWRTYHE